MSSMVDSFLARIDPRGHVTRFGWMAYGLALLTLVLDQLSKAWILSQGLELGQSIPVLPFFKFTLVYNPGISFGLLAATGPGRWLLVLFALAVVIAVGVWARSLTRPLPAVAVGLIMGGALGNNIIDRVRFGRVTDFLDFSGIGFFPWVFNVADAAINIGVAVLLIEILFSSRQADKTPPS
jgi:signal peptidase II